MIAYGYLAAAITLECIGTTALKLSVGMSKLWPSVTVAVCYLMAFWMMSLSLKTLPVGYVYALWAGVGIVGAKLIGAFYFKESSHPLELLGILLIVAGVVLTSLYAPKGGHG
jgi:small multidrug resistance pump